MVKYTAEQMDQISNLLTAIIEDTRSYSCSLPMAAILININNFLKENAVLFTEEIKGSEASAAQHDESTNSDTNEDCEKEIVLSSGGA